MKPAGLLAAALLLSPATRAQSAAELDSILAQVAAAAGRFSSGARAFTAREVLRQKALLASEKTDYGQPQPRWKDRQIVSWYALGTLDSGGGLREFRRVISVDAAANAAPGPADSAQRSGFAQAVAAHDDAAKRKLLTGFTEAALAGAATDFGQVILMFTPSRLRDYEFSRSPSAYVGAEAVNVLTFRQRAGTEGLNLAEGRRRERVRVNGELWLRQSDAVPLRITLDSSRRASGREVRDEAIVEYILRGPVLLPVSVVHRRYLDGNTVFQSIYSYEDWQPSTH